MSTLLLVLWFSSVPAIAQSSNEEIITLTISMHEQSCRRKDVSEPYVCGSSAPQTARLAITLNPVPPLAFEEQAFEGTGDNFAMMLPGSSQYMPWINLRKSVAMNGESIIYILRFRTQAVSAQIRQPAVFETVYISEETLRMSEPLMLMADRMAPDERLTKQTFFSLMPSFQFSTLIPDPEE